jgi:hypothetical protein
MRTRRTSSQVAPNPALRVVTSAVATGLTRHPDPDTWTAGCSARPPDPDTWIRRMLGARGSHVAAEMTSRAGTPCFLPFRSCEWGDSNPHGVTHWYPNLDEM